MYTTVDNITQTSVNIKLYPNPTTSEIMFELVSPKSNILITDVTGKVVMQFSNYTGKKIAVDKLTAGTYLFLMQSTDGVVYYSKFQKL